MTEPPPSPRIPHLRPYGGGDADALRLTEVAARRWFGPDLIVEEKLDGANVAIWLDGERGIRCAGRGGMGAMDRGGQLGRLRAWASERTEPLRALLAEQEVLYGEWLYLQHSVRYDRLPDLLCGLDLWTSRGGFTTVSERDRRCGALGLWTAPTVFRGALRTMLDLEALSARSPLGPAAMEGLILRREGPEGLIDRVKWVRTDFGRVGDADWRRGRPKNALVERRPT